MSGRFNMDDYVDVAERISAFYEKYPTGSLKSGSPPEVVTANGSHFVVYHAQAYRTPDDPCPADGWAWEPVPGPTPYTKDSELMNAETSAWGRAIVALGFETKKVASAQEVRNRSAAGSPTPAHQEPAAELPENEFNLLVEAARLPGALPSAQVVHFGKNRGKTLGELNANQVKWYAEQWKVQDEPSEYDLRLKQAAQSLNAGADTPDFEIPFS